jgi:hypothetical protein
VVKSLVVNGEIADPAPKLYPWLGGRELARFGGVLEIRHVA